MSRYVLSPRAKADIEEIWNYSVLQWGARQAENYIRVIQAALESVRADPAIARPCEEIRAGYRKYPAGAHVVFFRIVPGGIDVARILHRRMDIDRHL